MSQLVEYPRFMVAVARKFITVRGACRGSTSAANWTGVWTSNGCASWSPLDYAPKMVNTDTANCSNTTNSTETFHCTCEFTILHIPRTSR